MLTTTIGPDRRQGFTLLEVAVATALTSLMIGGVSTAIFLAQVGLAGEINEYVFEQSGRRVATRLSQELMGASGGSVLPLVSTNGNYIQYKEVTGYAGGVVQLGPLKTIELQLYPGEQANGLDDNGDGRIDESFLTIKEGTGTPVEISGDVLGLRITYTAGGVIFAVDLGRTDRDGVLTQITVSERVTFRNG